MLTCPGFGLPGRSIRFGDIVATCKKPLNPNKTVPERLYVRYNFSATASFDFAQDEGNPFVALPIYLTLSEVEGRTTLVQSLIVIPDYPYCLAS